MSSHASSLNCSQTPPKLRTTEPWSNLHGIEEVVVIFMASPHEVDVLQADDMPIKRKVLTTEGGIPHYGILILQL